MPLLRYFTYVGGALIALLFVVSYLIPEAETVAHQDVTHPNIRITTDRVVPPRLDFDTSAQTAAAPTLPPGVMLLQAPAMQARAQLVAPPPVAAGPARTEAKNEPRNEIKRTKVARRMAAYPHYAAYPYAYSYGYQPFRWTW
jgi:hypothetical protein